MRAIGRATIVALALVGCGCARGGPEQARDQAAAHESPWQQLGKQITALLVDGDPATLTLPKDVTLALEPTGFVLTLATPMEARELAQALGWPKPHAVARDVHQQSWQLQLFVKPLPDPSHHRIATTSPRLGSWVARPELDGRPAGELPAIVSGASPAYDLEQQHAKVVRLHFARSP